jgi:glucose-1-phosphate cytidylyltransferase
MKAVILAGGKGTRISEESQFKPKPMVDIGGMPIMWHIMKIYETFGINDFIICSGHLGYVIKEYFANYFLHMSDITFDLRENAIQVHEKRAESWKVTVVDTGLETMTGGRLKRIEPYIGNETFLMTYGDGLSNVDVSATIELHKSQNRDATLVAVQQPGRFGAIEIHNNTVHNFKEKPTGEGSWINGGFFVLEPSVFKLIKDDSCIWEGGPLEHLSKSNQLNAFKHDGFWQPMDTLRDKIALENLWSSNSAPWKKW